MIFFFTNKLYMLCINIMNIPLLWQHFPSAREHRKTIYDTMQTNRQQSDFSTWLHIWNTDLLFLQRKRQYLSLSLSKTLLLCCKSFGLVTVDSAFWSNNQIQRASWKKFLNARRNGWKMYLACSVWILQVRFRLEMKKGGFTSPETILSFETLFAGFLNRWFWSYCHI